MLSIRMTRVGSKKKPYFRVVVTEARSARRAASSRTWGPTIRASKPAKVEINKERMQHWLKQGGAAVGLGAHAAGEAPDARPVGRRRGAAARAGRAVMARGDARPPSPLRAVVEVVARALVDQPGRGEGHRDRAPRHDGAGADDGARRHGQDHRPPGTDGGGAAHAGGGDGREARRRARSSISGTDGGSTSNCRSVHGRLGRHGAGRRIRDRTASAATWSSLRKPTSSRSGSRRGDDVDAVGPGDEALRIARRRACRTAGR